MTWPRLKLLNIFSCVLESMVPVDQRSTVSIVQQRMSPRMSGNSSSPFWSYETESGPICVWDLVCVQWFLNDSATTDLLSISLKRGAACSLQTWIVRVSHAKKHRHHNNSHRINNHNFRTKPNRKAQRR